MLKFLPEGQNKWKPGNRDVDTIICSVTEKTFHQMRCWMFEVKLRGERPFLDFNHRDDGVAAFYIDDFKRFPCIGIFCTGEWSTLGEKFALLGKVTGVSPELPMRRMTLKLIGSRLTPTVLEPKDFGPCGPPPLFSHPLPERGGGPMLVEPFVPIYPWACMGAVVTTPYQPAIPACRINATDLLTNG